jgi:WD40 repeat protein
MDGKMLLSFYPTLGSEANLEIREVDTGNVIAEHAIGTAGAIIFNPTGTHLAELVRGSTGVILDAVTFERTTVFGDRDDRTNLMTTAVWSDDSSQLLTGSIGGGVHLWDATTGELIVRFGANPY